MIPVFEIKYFCDQKLTLTASFAYHRRQTETKEVSRKIWKKKNIQ